MQRAVVKSVSARRLTIKCSGRRSEILGYLLEDGRVLTLQTGGDGRDSLWESIEDCSPRGLVCLSHEIGEPCEVGFDILRAANRDDAHFAPSSPVQARPDILATDHEELGDFGQRGTS